MYIKYGKPQFNKVDTYDISSLDEVIVMWLKKFYHFAFTLDRKQGVSVSLLCDMHNLPNGIQHFTEEQLEESLAYLKTSVEFIIEWLEKPEPEFDGEFQHIRGVAAKEWDLYLEAYREYNENQEKARKLFGEISSYLRW